MVEVRTEAASLTQPTPTVKVTSWSLPLHGKSRCSILLDGRRSPIGAVSISTMLQPPTYRVLDEFTSGRYACPAFLRLMPMLPQMFRGRRGSMRRKYRHQTRRLSYPLILECATRTGRRTPFSFFGCVSRSTGALRVESFDLAGISSLREPNRPDILRHRARPLSASCLEKSSSTISLRQHNGTAPGRSNVSYSSTDVLLVRQLLRLPPPIFAVA